MTAPAIGDVGVPIVQAGAPVLRARAHELGPADLARPELGDLVALMIATMRAAPGVGLAAPQIGVPWRVVVLEDREELMTNLAPADRLERERVPFGPLALVNPVLRHIGGERRTFFEGCLSVDGYVALVERSHEVEVSGLDEHGAAVSFVARGWQARILQHEVDHLDGTLYVDRMLTRSLASVEQAKALFAGKSIAEIRRLLGA